MTDLEEFESWHEDLMAWERHQDELERIKDEDYEDDDELEIVKWLRGDERRSETLVNRLFFIPLQPLKRSLNDRAEQSEVVKFARF